LLLLLLLLLLLPHQSNPQRGKPKVWETKN
jgi:hypothetical protein